MPVATKHECQLIVSPMVNLPIALVILCQLLALSAWADAVREHDVAVVDARQGKFEEALRTLERLEATTSELRVRHDLIVVLGWAGRHAQAFQTWERMGWTTDLPEYVLLGLTNSLNALAGEAEKRGDRFDALRFQGHALHLAQHVKPEEVRQKSVQRAEADVIRLMGELGGHQGALWRSAKPTLQQRADQVALRLRVAKHLGNSHGPERKKRLEGITADLTSLISEVQDSAGHDRRLLHQLFGDRSVVFVEQQMWALALGDVEAAAALGLPLWPHIQMAQGAALLGLERPKLAQAVYEAVLAVQPEDVDARWGLFYALADQGAYQLATEIIDKTAPDRWLRTGPEGRKVPNADWLPARLAAARVRSWDEQQGIAWQQLKALRALHPDDSRVRLALASVAAARGWPRLAEQEVRSAQTLDEASLDVQLALAESALRRNQWREFRHRSKLLELAEPAQLARLERESRMRLGWQATYDLQRRTEPGRSGLPPGESRRSMTRLDGPLWSDGWRPFVTTEYTEGTTPEVLEAVRRRDGLGIQFQGPDNSLELQLAEQSGNRPGTSLMGRVSHSFSDQWTGALGFAHRAADAPLRAIANGIDMHTANLGMDYNRDESLSAAVGLQVLKYSDGNQGLRSSAAITHQLHASSGWRVSTRQGLNTSRNSSNSGPYFSPLRDLSVSVALISQRVWLRTPKRNWSDNLELQAGRYRQAGYTEKTISSVSYEQTFSPSPALEFSGGLTVSLRYFDGVPLRATSGHLRMVARF